MLSAIPNTERLITRNFVLTSPSANGVFDLPNDDPWNLVSMQGTFTSAATILIPQTNIILPDGVTRVTQLQRFPWQFAGTTVTSTIVQSPGITDAFFFSPFFIFGIPSDLHIFDGWQIEAFPFDGAVGVIFDMTFTLTQSDGDF